jgi:hypothetical protein
MSSNADIARMLLSKGATASTDSFVIATLRNDLDRMKVLHLSGVDINALDSSGTPAIVAAARSGKIDALVWLITQDALVNQTDINGISALSWARALDNSLAARTITDAGGSEAGIIHALEDTASEETKSEEVLLEVLANRKTNRLPDRYRPEGLVHKTLSGDLVRSKSEVIVADALYYRGISFRYEVPFFGRNRKSFKIPDFTITLPSGLIVVWEHLGMLDQESYRDAWNRKKIWYILNGLDHSDLYVTNDTQASGIDSHQIAAVADDILKRYRE